MKRLLLLVLAGLLGASEMGLGEGVQSNPQLIASFESQEEIQKIKLLDARVTPVQEHATDGRQALKIEFEPAARSGLLFPAGEQTWDWRGYGALAMDLTNPSDQAIAFAVRLDDDLSADDAHHSRRGRAEIGPRQSVTYAFPLGPTDPMEKGMRGGPPRPGMEPFPYMTRARLDEGHVTAFQITLDRPPAARTLIIDNIRLLPPVSYDGIVDAFGQYTRGKWPGKVTDESELPRRRAEEESQIQAAPTLPDRDEYGGWAQGPQLEASGFFRTVQRDGKWWLVTPNGHLFFSLGVDVVGTTDCPTLVERRENMFTWLPAPSDPLAKHYGHTDEVLYGPLKKGRTFDFYSANLERRYGPNYLALWRAFAPERLRAWGFNTIANWSDRRLYELHRVPYTATVDISGDFARVASGVDYWGKMPDPFDPRFTMAVDQSLRDLAQRLRDDAWCIGYFVDNELSWGSGTGERGRYGLVYGTLSETASQPAKMAMVEELKRRYGTVKRLNKAWHAKFRSWEALLEQPFRPTGALTPAMQEDFSSFLRAFARQYFRIIRDTLKQYDPNHLYLGCRFAWHTPEPVEASGEICDVVSFNIYDRRIDPRKWEFVNALHKPCIIGEFHFGALDRGMFHPGLVAAPTQQARAEMYQDYVRSVAANPAFVGCAWFEYVDEPLTGRAYDGENYNIGFVSVTDTPYPEMVAAAKAVHAEVYTRRKGQ
jgi:hypothetical protein